MAVSSSMKRQLQLTLHPGCLWKVPPDDQTQNYRIIHSTPNWLQTLEADKPRVQLDYYHNGTLVLPPGAEKRSGEQVSGSVKKFFRGYHPYSEYRWKAEQPNPDLDPTSYELWEDVPAFFELMRSEAWPWQKTVIQVLLDDIEKQRHARKSTQVKILCHHGFYFKTAANVKQLDPNSKYAYLKGSFKILPIAGTIRPFERIQKSYLNVPKNAPKEFSDHLYVARSLTHYLGVSGAMEEQFPHGVVLLRRPGDAKFDKFNDDADPSQIHIMNHKFDHRQGASERVRRGKLAGGSSLDHGYPIGVRGLPTVTSLLALANWKADMKSNLDLIVRRFNFEFNPLHGYFKQPGYDYQGDTAPKLPEEPFNVRITDATPSNAGLGYEFEQVDMTQQMIETKENGIWEQRGNLRKKEDALRVEIPSKKEKWSKKQTSPRPSTLRRNNFARKRKRPPKNAMAAEKRETCRAE